VNHDLDLGFVARKRVRLIRQTEVTECGLACLAMIANAHGFDVDLGTLRRHFVPSLRGAALKTLIGIADGMGFSARPLKLPLEGLGSLNTPAILHWDLSHYVVLEQVKRGKALIHDPSGRTHWIAFEEVSKHFTGVALEVYPADEFKPATVRQRLRLKQLWQRVTGLKRALSQTLILSLVLQAFVLTSPYYMQLAIDRALLSLDRDLLAVLALGFGLFTLINAGAFLLRSLVLLSAGSSLSFGISTNIARRLLRLPVTWFERRNVGDVLSRFQSVKPIQRALTQGTVAALLDGALAAFTLILLLFYSTALTAVSICALALYTFIRWITFSFERQAEEASIVAHASEQSMMIESIRGIVALRLFGREASRQSQWQGRLTRAINANIGHARIGIWQQTANTLIFGIENIATIWLAISFVLNGGFSLGMVFAFIAYKTQFQTRAVSLIDEGIAFGMLGLHLERLSDIALAEEDTSFAQNTRAPIELQGHIELREVSFHYSPSDPLVLNSIDLTIEPGEHIAITGPSGGGKSTLVKILLGLIQPGSGVLLVDGRSLPEFGFKNYRNQVAAVLQDDTLFAGSLSDNIALFDDSPDPELILWAAQAAAIHDDVSRMPMGFETLVGDMGSSLSGGQKQRLLLARALYRRPKLLILDEGTAHLDAATERKVNKTISDLGITRIVIAHRAETIAAADRVLVLEDGKIKHATVPTEPRMKEP